MANSMNTVYDVDLLRPGTVPIAPDTVLWFEFLLDPSLLQKHLNKPIPDPSPTDLIVKFLAAAPDVGLPQAPLTPKISSETNKAASDEPILIEPPHTVNRTRKNLALKILSLKVAAFLKWDFNILLTKIPLPMQWMLLKDLLYLTMDEEPDIEKHAELDPSSLSPHALFAVTLYHRWVLRAVIHSALPIKQSRLPYIAIPGLSDTNFSPAGVYEDLLRRLEMQVASSVRLLSAVDPRLKVAVPTVDCFVSLTESSTDTRQEWARAREISPEEFHCQLNFDVGTFYFYRDDYASAGRHFRAAHELYSVLGGAEDGAEDGAMLYCSATREEMEGYCAACDVGFVQPGLLNQMHRAVNNQYTGILGILQQDNLLGQIPRQHRDILELDIAGAVSSGKFCVARDLLPSVRALNAARNIAEGDERNTDFVDRLGQAGSLEMLLKALNPLAESGSWDQRRRIKLFLIQFAGSTLDPCFVDKLAAYPALAAQLSADQLAALRDKAADQCKTPALLLQTDWPVDSRIIQRNKAVKVRNLKYQLTWSYDPTEVSDLLLALNDVNVVEPMWKINNNWDLPIPVHSVVNSVPKGFLQDYCYLLLAKAKELANDRNFALAEELLGVVEAKARTASVPKSVSKKLVLLVQWEALLIRIVQFLVEAPQTTTDTARLVADCKECLVALQRGDTMIPRTEIVEHCAVCLLNCAQWDHLTALEMRWKYFGLAAAVAGACQDVGKLAGKRKAAKEAWDMILPTFGPNPQTKRSSSSATTSVIHRDSPAGGSVLSRHALHAFLLRLVDPTVLSVVLSLLARLHNVLRDEPGLELAVEHLAVWPAVVSNANSYHVRSVSETLSQVLTQALQLYPDNVSWLKLMADLNYATSHHSDALMHYLSAGIVASNSFTQPIPSSVLDNQVYKRMVKCCAALSCHTQAALLCQFLDEVDYNSALKSIVDPKCSDAMDSYYDCIWDQTILEYLVYFLGKRGEQHRKQSVIKKMGLLELNANNNEEIQREAINIRKSRFLRSLARQFVVGSFPFLSDPTVGRSEFPLR